MAKKNEVTFIRRGGKIIPIRKKKNDNKKAAAKVGAAAAITSGSAVGSAKLVEKSRPEFSRSAKLRGASKLAQKGSKTRSKLIRESAKAKVKGLRFQSKASMLLFGGTAVASIFASSAAGDVFKGDDKADEIAGFASAAVPFLGTFAFKKLGRVRFGGRDPKDAFRRIQKFGEKQSRDVVKQFEKAKFKGRRSQLDLFDK